LLGQLNTGNENVNSAVYRALPSVATEKNFSMLIDLFDKTDKADQLENLQKGLLNIMDGSNGKFSDPVYQAYGAASDKSKLLPVLASLSSKKALELVSGQLMTGNANEKAIALNALANWKNNEAIPYLFQTVKNASSPEIRKKAFENYLSKVGRSDYPADQKLLLVRKVMAEAGSDTERKQVLSAAQNIKTRLSLVFVSEYLTDDALLATASNAAIAIALPTP